MKSLNGQHGGTILGFIVGLIVGLVIAVIVAMVVTKTSIPMSNKQGNQGKISEPTASQMADPNKPLQGNNAAAKEAAKEFVKEEAPKADAPADAKGGAQPKPATREEPKKEAKADAKKDAKPDDKARKDDKADAKAEEKWTYYLQTNAYRDASEAESERAKLALNGFEARISEADSQGKPLYRLRMGPFSNIDTMNRVRGKLSDSGINAAVVRTPK